MTRKHDVAPTVRQTRAGQGAWHRSVTRSRSAKGVAALALAGLLSACASQLPQQPGPAAPPETAARSDGMPADWTLVSTVIVSRHGVRSPGHAHPPLDKLSPDAWPGWSVPAGFLTLRGGSLADRMGRYYGDWLRSRGALPAGTCPAPGTIYGWSDIDQRTRETGDALLQGMAPGCDIRNNHQADLATYDTVFHPVESGDCPLDPGMARGAIETRLAPEGVAGLNKRYAASLARMSEVLDYPASPAASAAVAAKGSGKLEDVPTHLRVEGDGSGVDLRGALGSAGTAAEVFLLQYGEGLPDTQVAWGRIRDDKDWALLMQSHNAVYDLLDRTPYLAAHSGTPLLAIVLDALARGASGTPGVARPSPVQGPTQPAGNRVYVLTGHDRNVANLAGMLHLDWQLPDQPDNTPPGGALVFTLWRDPAGGQFVRIEMVYQSMQQLRQLTTLSLAEPPRRVAVPMPDCNDGPGGNSCRWSTFAPKVKAALVPACLSAVR